MDLECSGQTGIIVKNNSLPELAITFQIILHPKMLVLVPLLTDDNIMSRN